jgi:tetratricopeptide (TPR) repeat protein
MLKTIKNHPAWPACAFTLLLTAWFYGGMAPAFSHDTPALDKDAPRLMTLAENYLRQGKGEAAINLLETALQLNPTNGRAHLFLGQSCALIKDYERARSEFVQCLKLKGQADVARQANQALYQLPRRLLCPKQIGSLSRDILPESHDKPMLLVCLASWQEDYQAFKDAAESLGDSGDLTAKLIEIDDTKYEPVFTLYTVSALPAVLLVAKGDQHLMAYKIGASIGSRSQAGSIEPGELKRLARDFAKAVSEKSMR